MIYINLQRILRLRGVSDHYKMLLRLGFAPATARNFLNNDVRRISFDHLELLCLALKCTPNDILEWQPADNLANAEEQALIKLKRDKTVDLSQMLGELPVEQLEQAFDLLLDLKNKQ